MKTNFISKPHLFHDSLAPSKQNSVLYDIGPKVAFVC